MPMSLKNYFSENKIKYEAFSPVMETFLDNVDESFIKHVDDLVSLRFLDDTNECLIFPISATDKTKMNIMTALGMESPPFETSIEMIEAMLKSDITPREIKFGIMSGLFKFTFTLRMGLLQKISQDIYTICPLAKSHTSVKYSASHKLSDNGDGIEITFIINDAFSLTSVLDFSFLKPIVNDDGVYTSIITLFNGNITEEWLDAIFKETDELSEPVSHIVHSASTTIH